jgi:hypothetical protein
MKKIACFSLYICTIFNIYAQDLQPKSAPQQELHNKKLNFGLQGGLGVVFFLTYGQAIASSKGGFFVEYTIAPQIRIQSGLAGYYNSYNLHDLLDVKESNVFVYPIYLMIPILLKLYPTRQGCLVGGIQMGYLIAGTAAPHTCPHERKPRPSISLTSNQWPVNRFGISILAGYEYEFNWGFIVGLNYIYDCISVMSARGTGLNWTLQPTIGYNFSRLF